MAVTTQEPGPRTWGAADGRHLGVLERRQARTRAPETREPGRGLGASGNRSVTAGDQTVMWGQAWETGKDQNPGCRPRDGAGVHPEGPVHPGSRDGRDREMTAERGAAEDLPEFPQRKESSGTKRRRPSLTSHSASVNLIKFFCFRFFKFLHLSFLVPYNYTNSGIHYAVFLRAHNII